MIFLIYPDSTGHLVPSGQVLPKDIPNGTWVYVKHDNASRPYWAVKVTVGHFDKTPDHLVPDEIRAKLLLLL